MAGSIKKSLINIITRTISFFGYKLQRIQKNENLILLNVFNTNFKKRVLVSYIKRPFVEGIKYHHTNYLECYTAADVFNELGYRVDVVDLFDNNLIIDYPNYDIVYGMGVSLEKAFYCPTAERILKIYYSTGCNPFYSFKASALQVANFYYAKGKLLPQSSRISETFWTFQYLLSDYVVGLGNQYVANTFLEINPLLKYSAIDAFYFDVYDIGIDKKNFEVARHHFLWFGSSGLLHKGLDLAIDIFKKRKDITLHICGGDKNETKFWQHYQPILDKCTNIIDHNFIDIQSNEFKELMDKCAFCLFPTASEGGAVSILNVMANGGLIPIASRACGINIDNLGFVFETLSHAEIETYIDKATSSNIEELLEKSKRVKELVRAEYSFDKYKSNLKKGIKDAINSSKYLSLTLKES